MDRQPLDNLVQIGQLKKEAPDQQELEGLIHSGSIRLQDSRLEGLSLESRFDLAYNAAHALALAALRWHGYRSEKRYQVFQCLTHTLDFLPAQCRVLDQAHRKRNLAEYEGHLDVDQSLVRGLILVTQSVLDGVLKLGPVSR